jgi:hypothetical protein
VGSDKGSINTSQCPLLAQSGHRRVCCTCPLLTQSRHLSGPFPVQVRTATMRPVLSLGGDECGIARKE